MKIIKKPEFEDDSYYFIIEKNDILKSAEDAYLEAKRHYFKHYKTDKNYPINKFFDRPSFTGIEKQSNIMGTIYTVSASYKNNMPYTMMMKMVKDNKDNSRRCVINIADTLINYIDDSVNTSCLNIIHYHKNSVKLFFRASDMTNELLYDLHLIKEFFIDPVFDTMPEIHVIASTAQNLTEINNLITNR